MNYCVEERERERQRERERERESFGFPGRYNPLYGIHTFTMYHDFSVCLYLEYE